MTPPSPLLRPGNLFSSNTCRGFCVFLMFFLLTFSIMSSFRSLLEDLHAFPTPNFISLPVLNISHSFYTFWGQMYRVKIAVFLLEALNGWYQLIFLLCWYCQTQLKLMGLLSRSQQFCVSLLLFSGFLIFTKNQYGSVNCYLEHSLKCWDWLEVDRNSIQTEMLSNWM